MSAPAEERVSGPACDIDPFGEDFLTDPFPALAQVRAAGPAVYLARYGVWAVAGYRDVHAVLRDHERFSSALGVGLANLATDPYGWRKPSLLIETDPPPHTRYRALVVGTMTPRALQDFRDLFEAEAARLVTYLVRRRRFNAVTDLAEIFPTVVFPHALGIQGDTRQRLLAYGALSFNAIGPRNRLLQESIAAAEGALDWIAGQCHRDALRPGTIGAALWQAAETAGLPEDDTAQLVRSLLSAGATPR